MAAKKRTVKRKIAKKKIVKKKTTKKNKPKTITVEISAKNFNFISSSAKNAGVSVDTALDLLIEDCQCRSGFLFFGWDM